MKALLLIAGLTAINAAVHLSPVETINPIEIEVGTAVPADLVPGVARTCSMLVFFDPACPACQRVADHQADLGDARLPIHWVTDDLRHGPSFMAERLPGVDLMMSDALLTFFGIKGVPAAAWIENGRVIATAVLSGTESAEDLRSRCDVPREGTDIAG